MTDTEWPVVPLCEAQLLDVNPKDILQGGLYRLCNVYKGGGGYDRFLSIFEKRLGWKPNPIQFVVQLKGCPLKCPYCYVTKDGIEGQHQSIGTSSLLEAFNQLDLDTFHLMGGAPALYLERWKELHDKVPIFHSDFLLVERLYKREWLEGLKGLHAVNFKHFEVNEIYMWKNLDLLIETGVNFYLTFTGPPRMQKRVLTRYGTGIFEDSFSIPIIQYKALS